MKKNTVYTIAQYMEQGFTLEEAPLAREFDMLHNYIAENDLNVVDFPRYAQLINILGL